MGVTNYLSSGKFVERDSYLPEGWSKQVCSDSEGNGYISYMSPNGETFRSRKAVDEYLATLVEPAASVVEGNLQFDQQKESASINTVETGVVDNAINQESNESQNTLVEFTKDTPLEVVDSNNLQSFVVNSEIPSKKPELNAELSLEFDTDDDDSDDEVDDNQCNICGNIFDEDKGLILHVEDVHKDYYFDEDNSLLLKEDLVSKENSMSKCKLCLENFKNEDLQLHMKGLHPSDYLENEINAIHGGSEQNYGTKDSKNDEIETNKIEETNKKRSFEENDKKRSLEVNDETDMDDDDEVDDNQCNICGKIFEEDKSLIIHVENIHKDYYFDEDNSLLLKEDLLSKENTVSKCKLCLENFKNEDLHQHMKGMHPTDYEETEINVFHGENDLTDMGDNLRKQDCEESDMGTDKINETDRKESILAKENVYKPNQIQNKKLVNNIIIDDDETETENKNRLKPMLTEQETSENHTLGDTPLKTFTAQEPIKTEIKFKTLPSNIPTIPAKKQTAGGREAPYRCNLCDIKYYVRSHLQVHNERMHKKCKWKCDACLTVYANEAELVEHNATTQHEYRTRTLMVSQNQKQTFQGPPSLIKPPPTSYQLNQNAQSPMTQQPNQNAYKNPQPLLNRQPNQTVQPNRQLNQNAQPLSNQNVQTLSNQQPNQNAQNLLNKQPNQNAQNLLNKQPNQTAQYLSNQGLRPAQTSISHQLKGIPQSLDSNKRNPQGNFQQANNGHTSSPKLDSDKWNPQGDISQLNPDKWNPQGSPATQTNTEYNPPQFVPQPRSKTYEPQDIKPEIKPILSQPNVPQVVKPAPPPSPPRPMDPVTKMHLAKVSQICRDLNLCDYPVPVNPSAKEIFRDPQAFGAYLLPLLMSVNPSAKMQDLAILGKAKWAQLLESQTGAMEPPAQNNGTASVVNTAGLVQHMQHLQILQSIGQH